jgi:hypothetical protein
MASNRVRVSLAEVKESEEQREKSERCRDDLDNVPDKEDAAKLHFNGLEVLLVEDNVVNQKVGKRMLHTLGCKVTVRSPLSHCHSAHLVYARKSMALSFERVCCVHRS